LEIAIFGQILSFRSSSASRSLFFAVDFFGNLLQHQSSHLADQSHHQVVWTSISVIDNPPMEQRTVFRGCWSPSIGGASNNPWAFIPPPQSTPPPSYGGGGAPPPQYPQQPQQPPNSLIGVVCNNFNKNWDNAKTKKKCKTAISFFRVEPPEGYFRYLYNRVSALYFNQSKLDSVTWPKTPTAHIPMGPCWL